MPHDSTSAVPAVIDDHASLRAAQDSLPFPTAVLGPDGTIRLVNEAWTRFGRENSSEGRPARSGPGANYLAVCRSARGDGADIAHAALAGIEDVIHGRREWFGLEYRCDSSEVARHMYLLATPLRAPGGGAVVVHIDQSESKRAEERLRVLQAQRLHSEKLESIGRLAGAVAHDFNNMLSVILGQAELALEDAPEDRAMREPLLQIRDAAHRSSALARELLAYARREQATPRVLDLAAHVGELLVVARQLAGERITVRYSRAEGEAPVYLDPSQLDRVVTNLVTNARDAIVAAPGAPGHIAIATSHARLDESACAAHPGVLPGDFEVLEVRDDGCGMPEDVLHRLFEPFFTTKRLGFGTGLGLATVDSMVRQNGGLIGVESAPGQGTVFRVHFPRWPGSSP